MHLDQADSRTNVDQQVRKNCLGVGYLKLVLRRTVALINKGLVWNVFEKKIATFYQALQLIFFVNPGLSQTNANTIY